MNTWNRETVVNLTGDLELSLATADDRRRPALHLGRWPNNTHRKWSGWIDRRQLHRLFVFLRDHPEYRDDTEPEDVDPADPFTP